MLKHTVWIEHLLGNSFVSNKLNDLIRFLQAILKQTNAFGPYDIPTVIAKLQNYHISIGVKKLLDLLDMIKQVTVKKRLDRFLVKIKNLQYEQAYF